MSTMHDFQVKILILSVLLTGLLLGELRAQRRVQLSTGEASVIRVIGTGQKVATSAGSVNPLSLTPGMKLQVGDRIQTLTRSYVVLGLPDGSAIEIQPDTDLELLDFGGGLRELLRIWLGKVRIKIRHIVGAPNPYRMYSPIATIGVRGTEFDIDVDPGTVTTVRVYEGVVSVNSIQVPSQEVLVPAGMQVIIYPMRSPEPPVSFERVVAENFIRESSAEAEIEGNVEPGEQPRVRKFLAYLDPHLDLRDNPAFITRVHKESGRLYVLPARSEFGIQPKISPLSPSGQVADTKELTATDQRLLLGLSSQISYILPIGSWTVAAQYDHRRFSEDFKFQISRKLPTIFGEQISIEQIGSSPFAPNLHLNTTVQRSLIAAGRRFHGQTIALALDATSSGGDINTVFEFRPNGLLVENEETQTRFRNRNVGLSLGYEWRSEGIGSLALLYRRGFLSGDTRQENHILNQNQAPLAHFTTSGLSHEGGIEWRKRLNSNLSVAGKASLFYSKIDESIRRFRIADSDERARFWIPSFGLGLGSQLGNKLFFALDYQLSFPHETSRRQEIQLGTLLEFEKNDRRDQALSSWVQYHLPAKFFLSGGVTTLWRSERFYGRFELDSSGRRLDSQGRPQPPVVRETTRSRITQVSFGIGRRFGGKFFVQYLARRSFGPLFRPFSHSLLFRFAF